MTRGLSPCIACADERDYREYQDALQEAITRRGLKRRLALLKRGEAVLWAASLLHGGTPVMDLNRTRLSQASHYFIAPGPREDQSYWVPSVSRYSARQIHLKSSFGHAMHIKAFSHDGPVAERAADRAAARAEARAREGKPKEGKLGPPVNAYMPPGFKNVDNTRLDVVSIYQTNRTRFWTIPKVFRAQCKRPAPPLGELVPCESGLKWKTGPEDRGASGGKE